MTETTKPEGAGEVANARLRAGWIVNAAGNAVPVLYRDVNGWAIADGCVILGRTAALQALADAAAQQPETLQEPAKSGKTLGVAIIGVQYRWPRNEVGLYEIPYSFSPQVGDALRAKVKQAIDHWAQHTKIRLRPRADDPHFVSFVPADFCASQVGRQGGEQQIWLAPDCAIGNVIHEIGHTVGLWHEHTRTDRNAYVEISLSNVKVSARPNFTKRDDDGQDLGDYDYESIMHYPADAFAINPAKPTIVLPPGETKTIGQRNGLSPGDIAAVGAIYP